MARSSLAAAIFLLLAASQLQAQDITQDFLRQGLPIPPDIQQILEQDPNAFQFQRAWIQKVQAIRQARSALEASEGVALEQAQLLAAGAAVTGVMAVPTIGGLYSGQTAAYSAELYQSTLFGAPGGGAYTARGAYWEMSRELFELNGTVPTWPTLPQDSTYYRPSDASHPQLGRTGEFLKDALTLVDPSLDFGAFDNDGPDGVPNSGDDDGFVDVAAFLYQDAAKSCGGPGIWPHRWTYGSVRAFAGYAGDAFNTNDASANGGVIKVSDYMIQAGMGCDGSSLMEIGTFSHEAGHALSLPDLYDTDGSNGTSEGIGEWGLMGSGNWNRQDAPAHMNAWSKDFLGWVSIETVTAGQTGLTLEPVYDAGRVLRYDMHADGEYFLLENRQPTGSDKYLRAPGLLIWHIDSTVVANASGNTVNADETHKGVDLEEADGRYDLDNNVNRSDTGDPYPGSTGQTSFNFSTDPSSARYDTGPSNFSLANIALSGSNVVFDVHLVTKPYLIVEPVAMAVDSGATGTGTLRVRDTDGGTVVSFALTSSSQAWLTVADTLGTTPADVILTADAASLAEGTYVDTLVITAGGAENSPLSVQVKLTVGGGLIALGDTVVSTISVANEADTFMVQLETGDTIDVGVFTKGVVNPMLQVNDPSGTGLWTLYDAYGREPNVLLTRWEAPSSGVYQVIALGQNGSTGEYVLKIRRSGVIVGTNLRYNYTPVEEGDVNSPDTIWVTNFGVGSAAWRATPVQNWITVLKSTGDLEVGAQSGRPEVGASVAGLEHTMDDESFDPGAGAGIDDPLSVPAQAAATFHLDAGQGLPTRGIHGGSILLETPDDPWAGPFNVSVNAIVYDAAIDAVVESTDYYARGIAVAPSGHLVVAASGNLYKVDLSTEKMDLWVSGLSTRSDYSLRSMTFGPDSSLYVPDWADGGQVHRVRPDGSSTTVLTGTSNPHEVAVLPDGTLYVATNTGIWRVAPGGAATQITTAFASAAAFRSSDGKVYFSVEGKLQRYDPATGSFTSVMEAGRDFYDLDFGSGNKVYAKPYGPEIYEIDLESMAVDTVGIPGLGYSIAVSGGSLYGTTWYTRIATRVGGVYVIPVVAVAPRRTLTVSGAGSAYGTVTSSPAGIDCSIASGSTSGDCAEDYDAGTTVTLTATPSSVSRFDGWSGGTCSGTSTCTLTMDQAQQVTAAFGPARIVAWIDSVAVKQGAAITLPVRVDMSAVGTAIGSIQARITFDTAVVSFDSLTTDFSGSYNANIDSVSSGIVRFAGINTSSSANVDTTKVGILHLRAKEKWNSQTVVDLDIPELAQSDFTNVTGLMNVIDGHVLVSPGAFTMAMRGEETVSKEESRPIALWAYVNELDAELGSIQGRFPIGNSVLVVDSVTAGDFGGSFDSNVAMQADSGFVRFAIVQLSPPAGDSAHLANVWVTGKDTTEAGDTATVGAVIEEITDPVQMSNLLPFLTSITPLHVTVSVGVWGDTNSDKLITALDALVCLSHVVGKDVSNFDPTGCDVAPDSGTEFNGTVSALDALAILSHVVGKSLPTTFRVGDNR